MSTEIKTKAKVVQLTQFSGGNNGLMLSINQPNYFANDFDETNKAQVYLSKIISQIHLNKDQAKELANDLMEWANS